MSVVLSCQLIKTSIKVHTGIVITARQKSLSLLTKDQEFENSV